MKCLKKLFLYNKIKNIIFLFVFNFFQIEWIKKNDTLLQSDVLSTPIPPTKSVGFLRKLHRLESSKTTHSPSIELDDLFISVKTTKDYHDTRLAMVIKTWFQLAKDQVKILLIKSQ
jgi:fringe protein